MRRIKLPQLAIVIVVCALVGALAGIAGSAAAPSKNSKKSSATATRAFPRHAGGFGFFHGPGGPGVHSESVVPNKAGNGFITVTSDAGTVKSISGSDITIDESVGNLHYKDATVSIPSDATIIRNHAKATLSDIKEGDDIRVIASSEQTIVIAESQAFQQQERKQFRDHGPWDHGPGRPGFNGAPPAAPQGGTTY